MSKLTVPNVLPLVMQYKAKPGNDVGGSLHIVLDDGNIEDHHIIYCFEYALENNDLDGAKLAWLLLCMSKTQRWKIYQRC